MPPPTELRELLDLHAVDLRHRRVEWLDCFGGMEAVVHFLKGNSDERCYCVTDVAGTLRALAFFEGGNLLFLTGANDADQRR